MASTWFARDMRAAFDCHLLNVRTGWPVSAWQSVSVVAPLCVVAGSCSTAMLLEQDAVAFLEAQGVGYLAVAADGVLHGSPAMPATSA